MKGDVGMSHREKEGNKKMPTLRQKVIHNPIPTSLLAKVVYDMYIKNTCTLAHFENTRCRDGVMNDFLSQCRHLLVPFFFMM